MISPHGHLLSGGSHALACATCRAREVELCRLEAEAEARCSFVQIRANTQWVWLAMDRATRQIIAFHVGDCSRESATEL